MEAKGIKKLEDLVEHIAAKKKELGETAAAFPKSSQEYLELPLERRMEVATSILETFAPNTGPDGYDKGNPAPADIEPSDMPGVTFRGQVTHKKWMSGGPERKRQRHGGIEVHVGAVESSTGVTVGVVDSSSSYVDLDFAALGGIKRGPYSDENGETQTGWYAWSQYDGKEHPLTGEFGQTVVEFVDVAVAGILDGEMLNQHRQFIGSQAVEVATQP